MIQLTFHIKRRGTVRRAQGRLLVVVTMFYRGYTQFPARFARACAYCSRRIRAFFSAKGMWVKTAEKLGKIHILRGNAGSSQVVRFETSVLFWEIGRAQG